MAALGARSGEVALATNDATLFPHIAGRLDRRMLALLTDQIGRGGPADPARGGEAPALHLNLTLGSIDSALFAQFVRRLERVSGTAAAAGVEIPFLDACAEPEKFLRARERLRRAGITVVLQGLSAATLLACDPTALAPDLYKLDWAAELPLLGTRDAARLREAMRRLDPARIVMNRTDDEAAIRWGLAQGVRRFQGRHIDAILGAARIVGCAASRACSLRQCIERGAAIAPSGRDGCVNPALLDQGAPVPGQAVAWAA